MGHDQWIWFIPPSCPVFPRTLVCRPSKQGVRKAPGVCLQISQLNMGLTAVPQNMRGIPKRVPSWLPAKVDIETRLSRSGAPICPCGLLHCVPLSEVTMNLRLSSLAHINPCFPPVSLISRPILSPYSSIMMQEQSPSSCRPGPNDFPNCDPQEFPREHGRPPQCPPRNYPSPPVRSSYTPRVISKMNWRVVRCNLTPTSHRVSQPPPIHPAGERHPHGEHSFIHTGRMSQSADLLC